MRIIVIAAVIVAFISLMWFLLGRPALPEDSARTLEEQRAVPGMTFTEKDVARHNLPEDCWMALNGVVYDATALVTEKPVHAGACGTDATAYVAAQPILEQDAIQTTLFAGSPRGTYAQ